MSSTPHQLPPEKGGVLDPAEGGVFESQLVYMKDGQAVTTSRMVAETFGKRHDNVLRLIKTTECSSEFRALNFEGTTYRDAQGKFRHEYIITRDGFAFLVMGFTGREAAKFKEAYIRAFNEMERAILPPLALRADSPMEEGETQRQIRQMEEKYEYLAGWMDAHTSGMAEVHKRIGKLEGDLKRAEAFIEAAAEFEYELMKRVEKVEVLRQAQERPPAAIRRPWRRGEWLLLVIAALLALGVALGILD